MARFCYTRELDVLITLCELPFALNKLACSSRLGCLLLRARSKLDKEVLLVVATAVWGVR